MSFSPVEASKNITEKYRRYLKTIFSIDDDNYQKQFDSLLKNMELLASGLYLDVSDSFEKGHSIEELINLNQLANGFNKINMPQTRPLYKHQECAIEKANAGENLIVSTGTGSGKTESFMIPILNHIITEHQNGTLDAGVRALLIYPMNALANDQIERLRELLSEYPEITYGSYTGQTKNKYKDALVEYKQLNENREPKENELISREQIKDTPPHILVTNYAMLEYLMVRPGDSIFFNEEHAQKWKYIVLDEAHVYNGSSGIEVAMLLRRLKAKLQNDNISYILTSATLGDENSDAEVADFGRNLCDSSFDKQSIIRAFRIKPKANHDRTRCPVSFYSNLAELFDKNDYSVEARQMMSEFEDYRAEKGIEENLYDIILHDENYAEIKEYVWQTRTIDAIAHKMGWTKKELTDFVAVASLAEKNNDRLFDARYHMFLRATESVFITLNPSNKLFLTRKKRHIESDGKDYAVFEIATCSVCHAIYLIGTIKNGCLVQSSFQNEDELRSVFLLKNEISDTDDDHSMEEENIEAEEYEICPRCGYVRRAGQKKDVCCEHGSAEYIKVFKVQTKNEQGSLTKCLSCENTNSTGILRMFFTGQEAVTSVVGTALFEELPSYKVVVEQVEDEDDWGFGFDAESSATQKVSEAKQFIAFSDSRQAAAYFSSYFDQTYRAILYKRVIVETLKNYKDGWKGVSTERFVEDVAAMFETYNIIPSGTNASLKEGWKAVLQELVDNNGVTSLYNMGLIGFSLSPDKIPANKNLGLSADEVCTLCNVFALGMMADAAIYYDYSMNRVDREFFAHGGVEYSYTLSDPDQKHYRRSFIPRHITGNNKRLDYFRRVMEKMGHPMEQDKLVAMLTAIWNRIMIQGEYLKVSDSAYKINSAKVDITRPEKWYICSKCKKITPYNLHGVCPAYKCEGELQEIDLTQEYVDNHYYRIYQELDIRDMRVVEHTAQLNKETAYEYQKKFKRKEIDVLSCSTTFEMGVDVGSLETVFMRNMPPSPANYAQRAGRAGRSKQAAAFALTFCNKSNHDFTYFSNPVQMIKGRIDPPQFIVDNEKIAIRHIYASALSFFWSKYPDYFSYASNMAEQTDEKESGVKRFEEYLSSKPDDLKEYLYRFLPESLIKRFDVDNYGWIESLIGKDEVEPGVLTKAIAEYDYEVGTLKTAWREAIEAERRSDYLMERIKVYQKEEILSFLSRKNVMPKYGFPVDTVEMSITSNGEKNKLGLQLQRDLSVAISEYAPGSQVVANGNLITSRYIRKVPRMGWKMYDYIYCDCSTLNIEPHVDENENPGLCSCHQCGAILDSSKKKTFLIPSFGFQADGSKVEKPGLKKPERTYRGEISYVGYRNKVERKAFNINGTMIETAASRGDEMAVINESNFYVCETCGYTDLDEKSFTRTKKKKHNNVGGYPCANQQLKKYSLGYRFETDVLQIRFKYPDLTEWETAISLLHGVIRGICKELNIEQDEISGCVQYYYNEITMRANFALVFYDKTPGGAGHVRRLAEAEALQRVLNSTLQIMESCTCGGTTKDSSCYSCLRSYYNQKYHDILDRSRVIDFVKYILEGNHPEFVQNDDVEQPSNPLTKNLNISTESEANEELRDGNTYLQLQFGNRGVNLIGESANAIWDYVLDDCDTNNDALIINEILSRDKANIEKPIYNESVRIVETGEEFFVNLIWKNKKVMLFLEEYQEEFQIASQTGWTCYFTGSGFDVDEFLHRIER